MIAAAYEPVFPHGLMFHRFRPDGEASGWQGALSAPDFERILDYAGTRRLRSPEEWTARLERSALEPDDLCVTFDDGLRCQIDLALPVLEALGVKAFWFVYTSVFDGVPVRSEVYSYLAAKTGGFETIMQAFLKRAPQSMLAQLETPAFESWAARLRAVAPFYTDRDLKFRYLRNQPVNASAFETLMDALFEERGLSVAAAASEIWMRPEDLERLAAAGHWIGLHSHSHPYAMGSLARGEQEAEYSRNGSRLEALTGRVPVSMSHPLNSYNADTLDVLQGLGVRVGFRANMAPPDGHAAPNPGPLELAREDSTTLHRAAGREGRH